MKSSIKKQVSFGNNFTNVIAQAAIKTKERNFSLGFSSKYKKPKIYTKKAYFAKADGGLICARDGGYKKSLDDSYYGYTIQVNPGGAGRLFTVVFDDKEKPVVVLDVSNKITNFSETRVMRIDYKSPEETGVSRITLQKKYDEQHGTTFLADAGLAKEEPVPMELEDELKLPSHSEGQVGGGDPEKVYLSRTIKINSMFSSLPFLEPARLNHFKSGLAGEFPQTIYF